MNRLASVLLVACVSVCTSTFCLQLSAQANSGTPSASGSSTAAGDSEAIALMQRVLSTMGGAGGWQSVGAATTTMTRTMPDGTQRKIHWVDYWSASSMLSRRGASDSPSGPNTVISSGQFQSHRQADGPQKWYPKDPDLVLLAVGYPGAAIHRSLERPNCTFSSKIIPSGRWPSSPLSENADETIIYEQCVGSSFTDARCNIAWIIAAGTAQLRGVWLPVRGLLHNSVAFEQVRYEDFQQVGNLKVPHRIEITRPTGRVDSLIVDSPAFSSRLPQSAFDPSK